MGNVVGVILITLGLATTAAQAQTPPRSNVYEPSSYQIEDKAQLARLAGAVRFLIRGGLTMEKCRPSMSVNPIAEATRLMQMYVPLEKQVAFRDGHIIFMLEYGPADCGGDAQGHAEYVYFEARNRLKFFEEHFRFPEEPEKSGP